MDDDFLDLVKAIRLSVDALFDTLAGREQAEAKCLGACRTYLYKVLMGFVSRATVGQRGVIAVTWDDVGRNLESAQIFDIGEVGSTVLEKGVGLSEGRFGDSKQLVQRLIDADSLSCFLLKVGDVGKRLLGKATTAAGTIYGCIRHGASAGLQGSTWTIWVWRWHLSDGVGAGSWAESGSSEAHLQGPRRRRGDTSIASRAKFVDAD